MTNETKNKPITVLLPPALYEKLAGICEVNHRSMSEQIRFWIDLAEAPGA